ncbi:hypothetical protein DRW48_07370 [Paracoccus suum]|uniref:Uncharacterized protein n=1 Tax=Paracoccus suum TaxID=2259340 RepID=A0A344PJH6_9RHOB|nr:hypothetical protein [Paracoccus suum]AXC49531.1 hypothetical protein DRW48_07370 [Paracoccus suum]
MANTGTLDADHRRIEDDLETRSYVARTAGVMAALPAVTREMVRDRLLGDADVRVIGGYLAALQASLAALGMKYLVAGRIEGPLRSWLTIDTHESGFPVWQEIAQTAADAAQAATELGRTPPAETIKDDMIRQIVGDRVLPTRLQYALSQRYYYEALAAGGLFWPQMHPQAEGQGQAGSRRRWLIHWAIYDSQLNVPVIYLLDCDDSGRKPLPEDSRRWPEASAHLLAQSVTALQLVTIAQGFDRDFDTLHPRRLRRLTLGPIYSRLFTVQEGPIRQVLDDAHAPQGEDWALAMTIEELRAGRAVMEASGLFSVVERQIFDLDPLNQHGAGQGATSAARVLVLPARPFQALSELDPEGFRNVRKYVVAPGDTVRGYA